MTRRAPVFRWTIDQATKTRVPIRVGELTQESSRWEFVFDPDYLARGSDAWELDPTGIRTKQCSPFTRVGSVPFPVFCDVALSGWTLDLLKKNASRSAEGEEPWGWWERLVYAPVDGFGALFVGDIQGRPDAIGTIAHALHNLTRDSLTEGPLASSSGAMGGERPKVALHFELEDGRLVPTLLKFALPNERFDSVIAEATALTLAAGLGMQVPFHQVMWFNDVPALAIERFDRQGEDKQLWHCVSAATALDLVPGADVEDPKQNYVRLRSKLKRVEDSRELFERIVLNGAVGNTDDHPWNTSLRQLGPGDWELSPLYDVLPFSERQGVPAFSMDLTKKRPSRAATRANLVAAGRQIAALDEKDVLQRIDRTTTYVRENWRKAFEAHSRPSKEVPVEDWKRVFEHDWIAL
ncbi:HipA domain-containing protein [Roseateles sp.]|uniref:type II toxin-antitoxin system HipA family toxin n=1 Tax=Roseateles sp. TaxID=1971397 RepID=UPI0025F8169B|nr:HipA domain-containing protein [Roseateles sp.]MBV8036694.1 HipA domain-containing protein [Roseateles sp.]